MMKKIPKKPNKNNTIDIITCLNYVVKAKLEGDYYLRVVASSNIIYKIINVSMVTQKDSIGDRITKHTHI